MSSPVIKGAHVIDSETRSIISLRYKRMTKAVNLAFWNSESDMAHSLYVGSYGRGTAIETSDLDVLMELPSEEYFHYTSLRGNGQSRLLQVVKNAVLDTYPLTKIRGDGQVVVVEFSDGMVFEILPAFKNITAWGWDGTYKYPNTHMGGRWLSTNPKAEQEKMKEINEISNGLLYDTCKHVRYVRDNFFYNYDLSGILIDSFVSQCIGGWHFLREDEIHVGNVETYEEMLYRKYNAMSINGLAICSIYAPGSNDYVDSHRGWEALGKVLRYIAR